MAYTAETIQAHTKIASAWANKIEQELATVGNYLGRVATKGLLNNLSADYKDFAWVDDEQAFYWYAGNGWFPYDVKRLKEGFTLVNLLGSYGSFDKDSDGDGVADGVLAAGVTVHSLSNGVQTFGANRYESSQYLGFNFNSNYNHKYFVRVLAKNNLTSGAGSFHFWDYARGIMSPANIALSPLSTTFSLKYGSMTAIHLSNFGAAIMVYETSSNTDTYITVSLSDFAVYDLTWMDQYSPMPQSLQEKYSVSKWVDMTDDDLANELPYVDGVAYVGVGL